MTCTQCGKEPPKYAEFPDGDGPAIGENCISIAGTRVLLHEAVHRNEHVDEFRRDCQFCLARFAS